MVTFSRAYPREAFWLRVLFMPFVQMFVALFKLTWLVLMWVTIGAFAAYRWSVPLAVQGARMAARRLRSA